MSRTEAKAGTMQADLQDVIVERQHIGQLLAEKRMCHY